jgi:hypothetical protein
MEARIAVEDKVVDSLEAAVEVARIGTLRNQLSTHVEA